MIILFIAVLAIFLEFFFGLNFTLLTGIYLLAAVTIKSWQKSALIMFAVLVCAAGFTLENYFKADVNTYSNSDHHAVRIDGFSFNWPEGYVLAANSDVALCDNEYYNGTLKIKEFDEEKVILRLDGFTQSLFSEQYEGNKLSGSKLLNAQSMISFNPSDTVVFKSRGTECKLYLDYYFKDFSWKDELLYDKDDISICQYIVECNGVVDTMPEQRIIKKGLDLNTVLGKISGIAFTGVNLIRPEVYTKDDSTRSELYASRTMAIELDGRAFSGDDAIREIVIIDKGSNKTRYSLNELKSRHQEIEIPIGEAFSIGCLGDLKASPIRFKCNSDSSLSLEYVTPKYQYLTSVNKNGANILYVTTNISGDEKNLTENILLFDLFENRKNKNNFKKPFLLTYNSGPTTQEMGFLVNQVGQDGSAGIPVKSGEAIPDVYSESNITWNVQIENFKDTASHLNEDNIIMFIFFLGLICMLSLSWYLAFDRQKSLSYSPRRRYQGKTYLLPSVLTSVEVVAYLSLILFFSFRLMLLWRGAVFPPAGLASVYEFNHFFRNEDALIWQFLALNLSFSAILSTKMWVVLLRKSWQSCIGFPIVSILFIVLLVAAESTLFDINLWTSLGKMMKCIFIFTFIVPVIVFVRYIVWSKRCAVVQKAEDSSKKKSQYKLAIAAVLGVAAVAFAFAFLIPLGTAIGKILVPVCCFLLNEAIIWKYWHHEKEDGGKYLNEDKKGLSFKETGWKRLFTSGLGLSLINALFYTLLFFFADGGYGIIFLAFALFSMVLKLYDFSRSYKSGKHGEKTVKISGGKVFVILLLGFLCVIFFAVFKYILQEIYFADWPIVLTGVVLSLVILCVLLNIILSIFRYNRGFWGILTIVMVLVGIGCLVTWGIKEKVLTGHTAQRVVVQELPPEKGLLETKTFGDERRFFEASVNDYALSVYNEHGNDIGVFGSECFKLRQHSKVGAMFGAQASDILPARFVISEHGNWLYVLFLGIYLAMLYYGVAERTRYRVSKMLLIQIPCLLLMHSLFVWLANTQLFIFLGQDVPLFSLHSALSVMIYFVLVTTWVCVAILDRYTVYKECNGTEPIGLATLRHMMDYSGAAVCLVVVTSVLMLIILFLLPERGTEFYEDQQYSLENLLKNTSKKFESKDSQNINELFKVYQDALFNKTGNRDFCRNINDVSELVSGFDKEYGNEIKSLLGADSFHERMWDKFVHKGGSKNNHSGGLIHVRKVNEYYKFAVRTGFYDIELPSALDDEWRGNVVASADQNRGVKSKDNRHGIKQFILPEAWVYDDKHVTILKNNSPSNKIIVGGDDRHTGFTLATKGYASSCRKFDEDQMAFGSDMSTLASDTYFARNVIINGRREFVFPMGGEFFWPYWFARKVKSNKKEQKTNADSLGIKLPIDFHKNIEITIDKDLTSCIYKELESQIIDKRKYVSVIVADGDGQIRAMVDRRNDKPEEFKDLNPNDIKRMAKLSEMLYMVHDTKTNDRCYGNINLMEIHGGPGSSQKPIVWTAVASGINYTWKDLKMAPIKDKIEYDGNYFNIYKFNGHDLNEKFKALSVPDENKGNGVDLKTFMSHSSNYYNALMLYIGAFNNHNMDFVEKEHVSPMFKKMGRSVTNSQFVEAFPVLTSGNNREMFRLNLPLPDDYRNSLLQTRLNSMFDFFTTKPEGIDRYKSLYPSLGHSKKDKNFQYADEFASSFGYSALEGYNDRDPEYNKAAMRERIHQAAVGGPGIWRVTPLFMAQCFGRLVMLKANYTLSVEPSHECGSYIPFADLSKGFLDARSTFLDGMNNNNTIKKAFNKIKEILSHAGYYVYAKTGTSNEVESEYGLKHDSLHRLGLVITNKDIINLPVENLKDVKFYTIYFTARTKMDGATGGYVKIVQKIIKSKTFKEYMHGNE